MPSEMVAGMYSAQVDFEVINDERERVGVAMVAFT